MVGRWEGDMVKVCGEFVVRESNKRTALTQHSTMRHAVMMQNTVLCQGGVLSPRCGWGVCVCVCV